MALTISLGFLLLFAAFLGLGEWALQDSTNRVREERLVIAQMAASQIDGLLAEAVSELDQARRLADFDPTDPDLSLEADILAHTYGQVGVFTSGVVFLDSTGRVVLCHPSDLYPPGRNLSESPHIARSLAQDQVTISEGFYEPLSHRPVVAVTAPIYDDRRRVLGLLSGLLDLSGPAVTEPLQQSATLGQTAHAALVDRQGRALASTFGLPFLSPGEQVSFYRRAVATGRPVVETVPFELELPNEPVGHLHVMAFAPLKSANWGLAVGGDLISETFVGVWRLRLGLALLGIVALASVWGVTLIGARRLMRPVRRVTEAAQRIAGGDLYTPLHSAEHGEIGAMAAALERMRQQLLANIEALAGWNETLESRVAEQTEELHRQQLLTQQLLRQAITAQEEERARLAREMHDGVGQTLIAVELSLDRLAKALPAENANVHERLNQARSLIEQTLSDLRRMIAALRPGVLDQLGLAPALNWLAEHTLRPLGLTVTIETKNLQERLPGEIETILFRIAQEAMSNVARHSQAGNLAVCLEHEVGQVTMTLTDNGLGCDLSKITPAGNGRGLGLAGMRERASLAGGQVAVESAPGRGTTIRVIIPGLRR
jgi:signal transduction histidine kinase